eukprot:TRINITY_DN47121_c0_g1_i1.p1 TRINITY_DN47121_c0_g1~~TRINITY_DN47121_c0_g1_i1.p1  ORF type:complete len:239 (+),score=34.62 TRINITY_DN47121_c0_g1_i1:30-719(+)
MTLKAPEKPNVLVCGTPGTGKTTLCQFLEEAGIVQHIEISKLVKDKGLHEGRDEENDTYIVDEDAVVDELESTMVAGGVALDTHIVDYLPERWFQLVVVLRTDTAPLFDRLTARGYSDHKRGENIESEIMNVVLDDAMSSYKEDILVVRPSNSLDEMLETVELIKNCMAALDEGKPVRPVLDAWRAEHPYPVDEECDDDEETAAAAGAASGTAAVASDEPGAAADADMG